MALWIDIHKTSRFYTCCALSHRWLDVLVEAEQVRRIVLVLEADQPLIVLTIGGPHALFTLFTQIIYVDTARQVLALRISPYP